VTPDAERKLFTPVQIGATTLKHRVVMAPLTGSRSVQPGDIPGDLIREYYEQRASDGGLIISEATTISITARGWFGAPGMYSDEQVAGWKKVVHAVRGKGGRMFSQLWHMGPASHVDMTNGAVPVAPSVVLYYWGPDTSAVASTPHGWFKPSPHRALDIVEIPVIVEDYRKAAPRGASSLAMRGRRIRSYPCRPSEDTCNPGPGFLPLPNTAGCNTSPK
jgi:N-ethylmaleimide reductase